ncbi:MAG: DsbA family protein, partial [Pseudomonadota bacterium]|nr:DsbA family protein [Pseudomonadota bacterium]
MKKREQQRKIKQEKQQAAQQKAQSKALASKVALFGIAPVLALFVLYTLLSQGPTFSPVEIADSDHIRGERGHPVSIVVYADFQCPACAVENETMARLWPQLSDRAHLIFRHFPVTST